MRSVPGGQVGRMCGFVTYHNSTPTVVGTGFNLCGTKTGRRPLLILFEQNI